MKIRIYFCLLMAALGGLVPCMADEQDQDLNFIFHDPTPIPAKMGKGLFYLPVKLNGNPETYYFLVDTGDSVSIIDPSVAAKLRLGGVDSITMHGIGSQSSNGSITDSITLDTPGFSITGARLNIMTFFPDKSLENHIAGVLGFDLLKHTVFKLDYINKTIAFFDPLRFTDTRQIQIPISLAGVAARTEITIVQDGIPYTTPIVIDTGDAGGIGLAPEFIKDNTTLKLTNPHIAKFMGVGGADDEQEGTVSELHLGDQILRDQTVELIGQIAGTWGLVGARVLSQYDVTFDAPDSLLLLRPNGRTGQSPPISTDMPPGSADPVVSSTTGPGPATDSQPQTAQGTGFLVKQINGTFMVVSVSQAHSGIHVGDLITQIDKTPTAGMDMTQFQKMLQSPIRRITVNRDGSEMQMRMLIAAPLPTNTNPIP